MMDLTKAKARIEDVLFDVVRTDEEIEVASCLVGLMRCGGVEDFYAIMNERKEVAK